jgi:hypothetical protein
MESEPAAASVEGSVEAALRELRDAIEHREAEHARRNRNRVLFSRAVLLFCLGIFFGLLVLGRGFGTQLFKSRLSARVQAGAPLVLHKLRTELIGMAPSYKAEVARTFPAFSQSAMAATTSEGAHLKDAVDPVAMGDLVTLTDGADRAFAQLLLKEFGPELNQDPQKALTLARALRAQEIKGGSGAAARDWGEPWVSVDDIANSLRRMGPPDPDAFHSDDVADAMQTAAMDLVKEKLVSGEFGLGESTDTQAMTAKGGL